MSVGNPNTFQGLASRLRQYGGDVPIGLAMTWVQNRLNQLIDQVSDGWSFQYGYGQFICQQSIFGTCNINQGSNLATNVVTSGGLLATNLETPGLGYTPADVLQVQSVGAVGGTITVLTVDGFGAILTYSVLNPGSNYVGSTALPLIGGTGTGATLNVTGTGNGTLPGDSTSIVGRQILFNGQSPIYDCVDNATTTGFQIGEAFGGVTGSQSFEITNVYFTPDIAHKDFESLRCFTDPPMDVQLPFGFTFEEINNIDPQRSSANTPFLLADCGWNDSYLAALPSGVTDCLGYTNASAPVPRKEVYPRQQSNYLYRYWYKKRPIQLQNPNDRMPGFIRGDVVFEGCLADLAMWDGTPSSPRRPNPVKYNIHQNHFLQLVQEMQILDGSVMQRDYITYMSATRLPYSNAFYNSAFGQVHPACSTADIGGMAFGGDDF